MIPQQRPQQYGYTTYYPSQEGSMTEMLNAIMPIIILMMMMGMMMPMMKGITSGA